MNESYNRRKMPGLRKMDSKIIDTRMENGYRKRRRNASAVGADGARLRSE